jgi:hypothetical protein
MKRMVALSISAVLAMAPLFTAPAAHAAGCVRGAIAGGIAGHYVAHHGLLGAGIGCAIGHHEAAKRSREQYYNNRY